MYRDGKLRSMICGQTSNVANERDSASERITNNTQIDGKEVSVTTRPNEGNGKIPHNFESIIENGDAER